MSAAVTSSFANNINQRLEWLGTVLSNIDTEDQDIRDVAPRIMDVLSQRLQGAYMQISEETPAEAERLRTVSALYKKVGEVRKMAG